METTNQTKTVGKTTKQRVVLALSTEQAEELKEFLGTFGDPEKAPSIEKISARISKTLTKQKKAKEETK